MGCRVDLFGAILPSPSFPFLVGCAMGISRFPPFDFDSEALRLRKRGIRVKLQRKPALLLAALLEQPGHVLTRQDLYARLWPDGTFVDFDQSLNVAIKKLRDSLSDSA